MPAADPSPIPNPQSLAPPAKDATRISGMFDAIAGRYDFLNHLLSAGLDKQWRKRAVDGAAADRPRDRARSLHGHGGFGARGDDRAASAPAAWSASIFPRRCCRSEMKKYVSGSYRTRRPAIDLVRGDAMRIPLRDGTVDATTIGFGIRNVEQPAAACREIARVLRPGGTPRDSGIFTSAVAGAAQFLPVVFPQDSATHRPRRVEASKRVYIPAGIG